MSTPPSQDPPAPGTHPAPVSCAGALSGARHLGPHRPGRAAGRRRPGAGRRPAHQPPPFGHPAAALPRSVPAHGRLGRPTCAASPAAAAPAASPACASGWRWPRDWRSASTCRSCWCRRWPRWPLDLGAATTEDLLAPAIDAGKGEIYVQLYRRELRRHHRPWARSAYPAGPLRPRLQDQRAAAAAGRDRRRPPPRRPGPGAGRRRRGRGFPGPQRQGGGVLGLPRLLRGERDDLSAAVPVYGRPPDITTPKKP